MRLLNSIKKVKQAYVTIKNTKYSSCIILILSNDYLDMGIPIRSETQDEVRILPQIVRLMHYKGLKELFEVILQLFAIGV